MQSCKYLLVSLLFISLLPLMAGALDKPAPCGTVAGKIIDEETLMGLPGVFVTVDGSPLQGVSNERGEFEIKGLAAGSHRLRFQFSGSAPVIRDEVLVKPERVTLLQVRFTVRVETREEVTVQAGAFSGGGDEAVASTTFSGEEVRRGPSSAGDVARIVASLPSVSQLNDQKNNLIVRGSSPNENLFIIDNIEVPSISHFPFQNTGGGALSLVNVDFIDSVSFSPGGFSSLYGDRMSSVTQLGFREGSRQKVQTQLSLDMVGIGGVAEGPLFSERGTWMVSYRRSYADLVTKMLDTGVTPGWSDLQGKLTWDLGARHKLTLISLTGWDESDFLRDEALKTGQDHYGLSRDSSHSSGLNWFALWGATAYSDTSLAYGRVNYHQDWAWTFDESPALSNQSWEETVTVRHQTTLTLGRGWQLRLGGRWQHLVNHYNNFQAAGLDSLGQPRSEARTVGDLRGDKGAVFAELSLPLLSHFTLTLGGRGDYLSLQERTSWSPRVNLEWAPSRLLRLDLYAGLFRQTLPLLLMSEHPQNRRLEDPLCRQAGLNLTWQTSPSSQLILALYGKDYDHLPMDPAQGALSLLDEQLNSFRYGNVPLSDAGQGRSYGLEISWQKKRTDRLYGILSASLFRSQYCGLDGVWRDRISDRHFLFNVVGGYKLGRGWELGARWLMAGGMPYTPFDLEASTAANAGIYEQQRINGERLKAYHSLNLSLDKRFFFQGSSLTLNLSLWNAYNADNTAFLFWNRVENRPDAEKQWSILPVLGVEYEF